MGVVQYLQLHGSNGYHNLLGSPVKRYVLMSIDKDCQNMSPNISDFQHLEMLTAETLHSRVVIDYMYICLWNYQG